jgi:hypothetical protein
MRAILTTMIDCVTTSGTKSMTGSGANAMAAEIKADLTMISC